MTYVNKKPKDNELPVVTLSKEQKEFIKSKLLELTLALEKWRDKYNGTFSRSLSTGDFKKLILNGSIEKDLPEILDLKSKLISFANDHVESLGGSLEYTIICSFGARCKSIARNRSKKISAELNIDSNTIYQDILQVAYASVQHSMYYFTRKDIELSTYVLNNLSRSIERQSRYDHCKLSAMSPEDTHDTYKCRLALMENPSLTVTDLAEEIGVSPERADEVLRSMSQIIRIGGNSTSSNDEASFDIISQIPDCRSTLDHSDNLDTVEFLKKIFDETDEGILSLTREERDVLRAACNYNFERGWQAKFASQYINRSTNKPYTRARIGQLFSSAVEKVRVFVAEAA